MSAINAAKSYFTCKLQQMEAEISVWNVTASPNPCRHAEKGLTQIQPLQSSKELKSHMHAFFHLRNIAKIRSILSQSDAEKLVHAFALNGLSPSYLQDLIVPYIPKRTLRSQSATAKREFFLATVLSWGFGLWVFASESHLQTNVL